MDISNIVNSPSESTRDNLESVEMSGNVQEAPASSSSGPSGKGLEMTGEVLLPVTLVGDYGLAKEYKLSGLWELHEKQLDFSLVRESLGFLYCGDCPYRTTKRFELTRHSFKHSKPYHCLRCEFKSAQLKDVVRHINCVHRSDFDMCNIEDFSCRWCGKSFKRKDNRNRHERTCMDGELIGEAPNQAVEAENQARIRRSREPEASQSGHTTMRDEDQELVNQLMGWATKSMGQAREIPILSEDRTLIVARRVTGARQENRFFELALRSCDEDITVDLTTSEKVKSVSGVLVSPAGCTFTVTGEGGSEHKVNVLFPTSS